MVKKLNTLLGILFSIIPIAIISGPAVIDIIVVLMGLIYTGKGPKAIINNDVCPLTLPACSLLNLPYSYGMSEDLCLEINTGDELEMKLSNGVVNLKLLNRSLVQ